MKFLLSQINFCSVNEQMETDLATKYILKSCFKY